MPPINNSRLASTMPGTASWLLATTLLLLLLCVGNLSRLAVAPVQASRPAQPTPALIFPAAWRVPSP